MPDKRLTPIFKGVISKIKNNGAKFFKVVPNKTASFIKRLPGLTTSFFKGLPSRIKEFIHKMPEYRQRFVELLKRTPEKMQGFNRLIGKGVAGVKRFFITFISLLGSVKKRVALIGVAFILFSTGAAVGVSAISVDQHQETELVDAFRVNLFDKHIGYVTDVSIVSSIINQIKEESAQNFGMDVEFETAFSYYRVSICQELVTDQDEITRLIRNSVDIKVNAFAMMVEDEQICILRNEEELEKLLDKVKEPFINNENCTVEAIDIIENIELKPVTVDFGQVQDAEAVAEEIAKGRETVEQYTVVSGDTLWGIAKKFDMSLDDIIDLNSDMANIDSLKLGQTLKLSYPKCLISVATTEVIQYEVAIPFKTEYTKDSSLYTNQSRQTRAGKNGATLVEAKVIKVNGIEDSREILSETVTKEPVTRIVARGTKVIPLVSRSSGGTMVRPAKGRVTSRFGDLRDGGRRRHRGIDIANSPGTPIYAAESGRVDFTGWSGGYGNLIKIDHGEKVETRYAHLSKILVSRGQSVKKGDLIGYMGSTGNSSGNHLHFEILMGNTALNPLIYIGR